MSLLNDIQRIFRKFKDRFNFIKKNIDILCHQLLLSPTFLPSVFLKDWRL